MMSGILSSLSKASSYEVFSFLIPWGFAALNQRSSKLVRTSYAAGPSILECKSCHGSRGQPAMLPCQSNSPQQKTELIALEDNYV